MEMQVVFVLFHPLWSEFIFTSLLTIPGLPVPSVLRHVPSWHVFCVQECFLWTKPSDSGWDSTDFHTEFNKLIVMIPNWPSGVSWVKVNNAPSLLLGWRFFHVYYESGSTIKIRNSQWKASRAIISSWVVKATLLSALSFWLLQGIYHDCSEAHYWVCPLLIRIDFMNT